MWIARGARFVLIRVTKREPDPKLEKVTHRIMQIIFATQVALLIIFVAQVFN